jgi:RHS repeat-associated protein
MTARTRFWSLLQAGLAWCALPAAAGAQPCTPPGPPAVQVAPAGCVASTRPTFAWVPPTGGAVDYRLTVFDPNEDAPIDVYIPDTSYRPAFNLTPGVQYRWKVMARWATCSAWSQPGEGIYFRVGCTPPPGAENVSYYHLDAVGSVRAVTNQAGAVVEQHDYLPFGEEWCGSAPCPPNAAGESVRFTGKERDAETGLDYFGARYYGPRLGRFTAVDPVQTTEANLLDPERWNRYAYARNNPQRYVDPDGRQVAEAIRWGGQSIQGIGHPTAVRIGGALIILAANIDKIPTIIDSIASSGVFANAVPTYPGVDIVMDRAMTEYMSGGIYEFPDRKNPGRIYVGQSGETDRRLKQHEQSGRKARDTDATVSEVSGDKTAREVAEQRRINELGGTREKPGSETSNIRNPIGKARQDKMNEPQQ